METSYPPGPKASFLVGHLPALRREQMRFLQRCVRDYGDFVPLRLGPTRTVLLNHPDFLEQVFVADHRKFNRGLGATRNRLFFGDGLITSEGDAWRRQRTRMQPAFHRERIAAYADTMVACVEAKIAAWRDGETRDVHREMTDLALQILLTTLFGGEGWALWDREAGKISAAMETVPEALLRRLNGPLLLLPEGFPSPTNRRLRRAVRQLDALLYLLIRSYREKADADDGSLLARLLAANENNGEAQLSDALVRDELLTMLFAGHETTASALTWACRLPAEHPGVQEKLQAELREVLGGRPATAADRAHLPITESVILETLRLYPPAWISGRQALEPTEIGGYAVPKGAVILMSQWVMQRDPRWFDAPEAFCPERWENDLAKRLPRFAYFPFGGGPHVCIGNHFALMEATMILATVARKFRFVPDDLYPAVVQPAITLRPQNGMRLRLEAR